MEVILANGTHGIRNLLEVVTIYPKKSGNFGQNLNGKYNFGLTVRKIPKQTDCLER